MYRPMAVGNVLVISSDDQLVAPALAGDREALDELFRRYRSVAYRVAYRLLGHEADALDAVQEGFVKALTHLRGSRDAVRSRPGCCAWSATRHWTSGAARAAREMLSMDGLGPKDREEMEPAVACEPGQELHREDLRRQLHDALAQLPAAQRQTFVLHAEAELSYREVAEALGISIGTVMSRLYYARQRLRAYLETWSKNP